MSANKKLIRSRFRSDVFERDKYTCRCCNKVGKDRQGGDGHKKFHKNKDLVDLDAHHIENRNNMENGGYVKENGISVCDDCHLICERYWIVNETEEGFYPDDLFKLIGSSLEEAQAASKSLSSENK